MKPVTPETILVVDAFGPQSGWQSRAVEGVGARELEAAANAAIASVAAINPTLLITERDFSGASQSSKLLFAFATRILAQPAPSDFLVGNTVAICVESTSSIGLQIAVANQINAWIAISAETGEEFRTLVDTTTTNAGGVYAALLLYRVVPPAV